ncbi:MAG TPA: DegT/DnrJ/EryC1/StrS family aminotransferase [Spirochaetes bacterium]|nr:DegT/DnrJ/EryC1/StrS family aminotransferase [Spirochaetota bacterium]
MAELALNGGTPVRTKPFHPWPVFDGKEKQALIEVLESRTWGTLGPRVGRFEELFAEYLGCRHALGVCNGTVSLEAILRALMVGPGDEVVVPPYTFVATVSAVLSVGAVPVFADIDPRTNCVDPAAVENAVTDRTRAVIVVHMGGYPCDMDPVMGAAGRRGIPVIEDTAQAPGSEYRGRRLGTIGTAGSFSFQLSKNMSAGEGGAITTDDDSLADLCWSVHHCGRGRAGAWYGHPFLGSNYRMTDWQAAVLIPQLERLDEQIGRRERNAALLNRRVDEIPGLAAFRRDGYVTRHTWHLYQFRYRKEEFGGLPKGRFVEALAAEGVPCSTGYVPLNREPFITHPYVRRITGDRDYSALTLPGLDRACEETVWITQNVLLGSEEDIDDAARALEKIRRFSHELV